MTSMVARTVERQLLTKAESGRWDNHRATKFSDAVLKAERSVFVSRVNLESSGSEGAQFALQCGEHIATPPSLISSPCALERLVIGFEHGVGSNQPMLGREYEPEVTSSFYLAATTSEEWRRV
jgi:hypothetical protein